MSEELKEIKKIYGESMSHLCRDLFPTLLEEEGLLLQILKKSFAPNKSLANDIIAEVMQEEFKDYIYSFIDVEKGNKPISFKKPKELLKEAGYDLYHCKTEEDIQSFKRYYSPDEELCTFWGGRLRRCHVFFAVKEGAEQLKREDFQKPTRQDEYGISVISIQFTKDAAHTLSIKNRYNHTVNNPDATFSNNLDNIIPGLTDSFAREGYVQEYVNTNLELPHYVLANDGKYYKYNYEINNVYYCPNNIIIDNFEVHEYNKDSCIIFDYFILDLQQKKLLSYDSKLNDSFLDSLTDIKNINIQTHGDSKEIIITPTLGEEIILIIDKEQRLISYSNPNLEMCDDDFLTYNETLVTLDAPNLKRCGDGFLSADYDLAKVNLSNLKSCGDDFLSDAGTLNTLSLPKLEKCGDGFLESAEMLTILDVPNLKSCGHVFAINALDLTTINIPKLEKCGEGFLDFAEKLSMLDVPNLKVCGGSFLSHGGMLTMLNAPNLKECGNNFLTKAYNLNTINVESLEQCGNNSIFEVLENLSSDNLSSNRGGKNR